MVKRALPVIALFALALGAGTSYAAASGAAPADPPKSGAGDNAPRFDNRATAAEHPGERQMGAVYEIRLVCYLESQIVPGQLAGLYQPLSSAPIVGRIDINPLAGIDNQGQDMLAGHGIFV